MKAVVKIDRSPGTVIREIGVPANPGPKDVVVRVLAGAVCGTDVHIHYWTPYAEKAGVKVPMILGHEFCGVVESTGSQVARVRPGDLIACETHIPCGTCFQCTTGLQHVCRDMKILGVHVDGAFAQYAMVPEICCWKLAPETPPDIGAVYEPFGIAVHALAKHQLPGADVMVHGCGPIGCFAVGLARLAGAGRIIAVDVSGDRLKIASAMGADIVADPRESDLATVVSDVTHGKGIDVFIESSGAAAAIPEALRTLRRGGAASFVGLPSQNLSLDFVNDLIYKEATFYGVTGRIMFDTWWQAWAILNSGKIDISPVITHRFGLSEFHEAIKLAKSGKCGKIILYPEG